MSDIQTFEELDEMLVSVKTVGISGHVRPDGDCVGSTLAVYNYIKDNYPQIMVRLYLEPIPDVFSFLQRSEEITFDCKEEITFDLFVSLDCGSVDRLGNAMPYFYSAGHTVCIDHHESNLSFADDNYIFPDASSTCELVYELLPEEKVSKQIAECLYTGIVHDTGIFQYSCTSPKTMVIGGKLMEKGIDYPKIVDETFYAKTFAQNKIMGYAVLNSKLYLDGQCVVGVVTSEDMKKFGVNPKDMDGIVNRLRNTKGVRVAVFMYQNEDGSFKVSTRGTDDTNLATFALQFGGGGHAKAAGFTLYGSAEENIAKVIEALAEYLK